MKKEQERAKLHSTIWKIANDLRGSVDGWDFKQYVLGMLLYRFISENLTNYINTEELRDAKTPRDFNFAKLKDDEAEFGRSETVKDKGFYILPSELFENVRKNAKNDENLNETLSGVFRNIENSAKGAESEDDIKGLFDDIDVNSNKLGSTVDKRNKQLVKLLDAVGELQLGSYKDNTIDAFGDAYEFLMGMYASNAGKSGGEYYTPQEVSELLARIAVVGKTEVNKVYDPAAGSGSLLLQFAKILGKENVRKGFYGQEININTYNLCRINMILHDINYEKFSIAHGDTLVDPSPEHWDEEPFEAIVSNPPYSINWAGDSDPILINDPRFSPAGVLAPKSKADLAFTMHMLSWLSTTGTAAIVEFPAVLTRGGAEQKIRKYLIDNNFIDAVIQLPLDLFFGTTIGTCILVLKKSKKDNAVLFIDAAAEFVRGGNKNKLSTANRAKILETYTDRKDIEHFAKLIPSSEIQENNYNIAVSSYVKQEDTREVVDIAKLNAEINEIVTKQQVLRKAIDEISGDIEGEKWSDINKLIKEHCPNGVEYKELGEVLNYEQPGKYIVSSTIYHKSYTTPVLTAGKNFILGFTNETNGIYKASKESPVIIFDDFTTSFHWVDFDFKVKSSAIKILQPQENEAVDFRYLYYAMKCIEYKPTDHSRHWISQYSKFKIPVPPKPIRKAIVNTLDSLTEMKEEIEVSLAAELNARRKQYESYRKELLTFEGLDSE